jgi:hypothetical protein
MQQTYRMPTCRQRIAILTGGTVVDHLQQFALAAGLAWASGIRLYTVLFVVGLLCRMEWIDLPPNLQILANPLVLGASGFMLFVEFFADKIPGVDSLWDAVHTFIRIPAGALLAAGAIGDSNSAMAIAAGILGGAIATGTHFTKAGSRALINTSPEPLSNWTASFTEEAMVAGGLWAMFQHPLLFLIALAGFIAFALWLLPKLWRGIRRLVEAVANLLRGSLRPGRDRYQGP